MSTDSNEHVDHVIKRVVLVIVQDEAEPFAFHDFLQLICCHLLLCGSQDDALENFTLWFR